MQSTITRLPHAATNSATAEVFYDSAGRPAPARGAVAEQRRLQIAADVDLICDATGSPGPVHALLRKMQRLHIPADLVMASDVGDCGARLRRLRGQGLHVTRLVHGPTAELHALLQPLDLDLYLTGSAGSAIEAQRGERLPAGAVTLSPKRGSQSDKVTVVFDFDGVMADDEAQQVYDREGLAAFRSHEAARAHVPMAPGPLHRLARAISQLLTQDPELSSRLRLCVVTARGDESIERLYTTLEAWRIAPSAVLCLSGKPKGEFIARLQADVFFDDQAKHLEGLQGATLAVHVPPLPETVLADAELLRAA